MTARQGELLPKPPRRMRGQLMHVCDAGPGEAVEAIARDGAVLLSLALQHGAALDTIAHAVTRDGQGAPSTIVGAVVDRLTAMESEP